MRKEVIYFVYKVIRVEIHCSEQVMGDKSGHFTAEFFRKPDHLEKLDLLQKNLGVSLKIIHVLRNPFDVLATRVLRSENARDSASEDDKVRRRWSLWLGGSWPQFLPQALSRSLLHKIMCIFSRSHLRTRIIRISSVYFTIISDFGAFLASHPCTIGTEIEQEVKLSLSLPRVINVKFPLQSHQKYHIKQYGEPGFS